MHESAPVAVLGATGFLGSHLVDELLGRGYRVRALGRTFPGLIGTEAKHHPMLEYHKGDFSDQDAMEQALAGVELCFHLISTTIPSTSNLNPSLDISSNLIGTLKLLEVAVRVGIRRIVFASSGGTVYGPPQQTPIPESHPTNPTCSYGIVKLAIEKYLAMYRFMYGLDSVALRFANPYGDRQRIKAAQGAAAVFLSKALRGELIEIWGDGSVVRDYLHVSDAVNSLLAAAMYVGNTSVFNIGSGQGLSLNELVSAISFELGRPIEVVYRPRRSFDVPCNILDIQMAASELSWRPLVPFSEGLARMRRTLTVL